ncbi:hypothetical protein M0802_008808 [Mischocyttarus mexicanus]|nr:hypothetical protein M0802_008808 [Mischocyttarus mexicanus]
MERKFRRNSPDEDHFAVEAAGSTMDDDPWLARLLVESRSGSLREGKEGFRSRRKAGCRSGSAGAGAREALSAAKRNLESQKVVRRV